MQAQVGTDFFLKSNHFIQYSSLSPISLISPISPICLCHGKQLHFTELVNSVEALYSTASTSYIENTL